MKRGRGSDEDDVQERPEKFQEISSQPDEIFGSQEFSSEEPESPFVFDLEQSRSPSPTDYQSQSDSESPYGSQPLAPLGSQLTEEDLALLQRQLNEFLDQRRVTFETAITTPLEGYPDAFKNQDEPSIEAVLSSLGSLESVTTHQPEHMELDIDPAARSFSATSEQVVEKESRQAGETREQLSEVGEIAEIEEIELDEEMAIYISQTAEQVFDDAFKEFLNDAIQKAMQEVPGSESSSQALRLEILYDPLAKNQFSQMRSESLDDLRSEIWELVQQEGMVEG